MKTFSKIFILVIFTTLLSSCELYVIKEEVIEEVNFAADIEPIFVNRCSGCHPGVANPDFTQGNVYNSLTTYDGGALLDLANPANSKILDLATNGHSFNDVSTAQEAKILKWIEDGAQND